MVEFESREALGHWLQNDPYVTAMSADITVQAFRTGESLNHNLVNPNRPTDADCINQGFSKPE